jgi:Tfp pilus assembly protein PilO
LFSLKENQKDLEELRKDYQSLKQDLEKIDSLFLEPDNPVNFLNYLEKTALSSGVSIKTSGLSFKSDDGEPWPYLTLVVSFSSDFSNSSQFLARLGNSPFLVQIEGLNIKKTSDGVDVSLPLKVFTKPYEGLKK